jgi:hypothetical protein
MAAGPQLPEGAASSFDYWLRRCDGFLVDSPQGRVGFVEEVRYASRADRPDVIAVRAGLLGRLLLIVPIDEIAEILPREERIVLQRSPRPTATKRLRDLRGRLGANAGSTAVGRDVEAFAARARSVAAQGEVEAVIKRLGQRVGLRLRRGGEREVTPDVEPTAELSAEEPSAEEPSVEEATAEAAGAPEPAEESAAPPEEQTGEEQTTP